MASCSSSALVGPDLPTEGVTVGDSELELWVADEVEERRQGLRGVDRFPPGVDGMLFVFPDPVTPSFVMLDAELPLDLWFFDDKGVLVGAEQMEPCPREPCPRYPAPGEVRWAIETLQGSHDLELGDLLATSASD